MVTSLLNFSEAASLGLHAMALLARCGESRRTNRDLAEALGASVHHLAKVMQRLTRAGLVDSTAGPQGGFCLATSPGQIKLLEIYEAIEGPLGAPECLLTKRVCQGNNCVLGELVHRIDRDTRSFLSKTTLATLVRGSAFLANVEGIEQHQQRQNH
jgi:Rrf2 family protein